MRTVNKKLLIIPVVVLTLFTFSTLATNKISAEEESSTHPIIQKLVDKFNLNQDEVEAVFEENRQERQTQRQADHQAKLDQAVEAGILTEDQKNTLLEKQSEFQGERGQFKDLSQEERQKERQSRQDQMQSWAEENGIDLEALHEFLGQNKEGGPRDRGHRAF